MDSKKKWFIYMSERNMLIFIENVPTFGAFIYLNFDLSKQVPKFQIRKIIGLTLECLLSDVRIWDVCELS